MKKIGNVGKNNIVKIELNAVKNLKTNDKNKFVEIHSILSIIV